MRIAYTIEDAAQTAAVSEHAVTVAINNGALPVRRVGDTSIILATDIQTWLEGIEPI